MKPRFKSKRGEKKGLRLKRRSSYFLSPSKEMEFVSTGCALLDCVIGGGYPLGRIVNIVGDKSTGKTQLAGEAVTNFKLKYMKGHVRYAEAEAAYAKEYAREMGVPIDQVDFKEDIDTVEGFFFDLNEFLDNLKGQPGLYILDSLDSLSDEAEQKRKFDENSFGGTKPKKMGELFRRLVRKINKSRALVIIISQVRDNIGVMFGDKHTRTGGKALDFYASQIIWLAQVAMVRRTIRGDTRTIIKTIRARCKKNKVGLDNRECEFDFRQGYGIDDFSANLKWLQKVKRLSAFQIGLTDAGVNKWLERLDSLTPDAVRDLRARLGKTIAAEWGKLEAEFMPKRKKYG